MGELILTALYSGFFTFLVVLAIALSGVGMVLATFVIIFAGVNAFLGAVVFVRVFNERRHARAHGYTWKQWKQENWG